MNAEKDDGGESTPDIISFICVFCVHLRFRFFWRQMNAENADEDVGLGEESYSADNAIAGSTRAARRAGTQQARAATAISIRGTATNVCRSVAGTPKS